MTFITTFLTGKREYLFMAGAIISFLMFPPLIRHIDIISAPIYPGALSAILMAVIAVLTFKAVTWQLIRLIWPVLAEYSAEHFVRNFKSLLSWQKVIIYLCFYLLLFFSFVITLAALM